MAFRERPYSQFNFTVDFGTDKQSAQAGFQEISGLGLEITTAEYRPGNYPEPSPMKVNGISKVADVTCKRGLLGEKTLADWLEQVRTGDQSMYRTVTISLLSEDRSTVAQTWTLSFARPVKYTGPQLSGKGTDVAIEELVLGSEKIVLGGF